MNNYAFVNEYGDILSVASVSIEYEDGALYGEYYARVIPEDVTDIHLFMQENYYSNGWKCKPLKPENTIWFKGEWVHQTPYTNNLTKREIKVQRFNDESNLRVVFNGCEVNADPNAQNNLLAEIVLENFPIVWRASETGETLILEKDDALSLLRLMKDQHYIIKQKYWEAKDLLK